MRLSAAEVFWVITGFSVPDNAIPIEMRKKIKHPIDIVSFFAGEEIRNFQCERVRQECKIWMFKKHPFLLEWNINSELLKIPGLIESFFNKVALKTPYIKVARMPIEFHVSVDPWKERKIIETNIGYMIVVKFNKIEKVS